MVSIRPATTADYDLVFTLLNELEEFHRLARPDNYRRPPEPWPSHEAYAALMQEDAATMLLADTSDGVIGLVSIIIRHAPELPIRAAYRYAEIGEIVVRTNARRSGAGKALIAAASRWAAEHGASSVELQVQEFNCAAIAFYEALGFETASRKMKHIL